jgi:hypothetical protein
MGSTSVQPKKKSANSRQGEWTRLRDDGGWGEKNVVYVPIINTERAFLSRKRKLLRLPSPRRNISGKQCVVRPARYRGKGNILIANRDS